MKTAISIPDDVYRQAEYLAAKEGLSRSQLYVLAIRRFIQQQKKQSITEQLNRVYVSDRSYDERGELAALSDLPGEGW